MSTRSVALLAACALFLPGLAWAQPAARKGVVITETEGKLRIEIEGELFAEYITSHPNKPFFYPIHGPSGRGMTRNWPMKKAPDEAEDHIHHRGLWYSHGNVNGVDFWSESPQAGRIVHERFTQLLSGPQGVIGTRNRWVARDGKTICTDERTYRISHREGLRMLDVEITLHASEGELRLGDTKEGTMALRIAETMRLKGKVGAGRIVNSEGVRDGATWGKRAKWVDYHGPVEGELVGVAIFDHPSNPKHPTWWHVRDYGLFAANPFGVHDFEKQPPGTGDLVVPAGQHVRFRYRFVFHLGDEQQANIARLYQEYAAP
jgi:hypothetical protein